MKGVRTFCFVDMQLLVREYQTKDGRQIGLFTSQLWTAPFAAERLFANCVSLPYRPALFQKPRVQADENTHNVFFANVSIAHVTCALRLESLGICRGVD